MLISLTYLSTATQSFDEADLVSLLSYSRGWNQAHGFTGMLLHAEGHFVQTLEGPAGAVDQRFAEISADPRHRDVIVALREKIETRVFPDWSMGFAESSSKDLDEESGFNDFLRISRPEQVSAEYLGRAGIFHRVFRDKMRREGGSARRTTT